MKKQMIRLLFTTLCVIILVSILLGSASAEETGTVFEVGVEKTYTSLETALSAALADTNPKGAVIVLSAGEVFEIVNMITIPAARNNIPLTIKSSDPNAKATIKLMNDKVSSPVVLTLCLIQSENVTIDGIEFKFNVPELGQIISYRADNLTVRNCVFHIPYSGIWDGTQYKGKDNSSGTGIVNITNKSYKNILIDKNLFINTSEDSPSGGPEKIATFGIVFDIKGITENCENIVISNNTFTGNFIRAIWAFGNGVTISNNTFNLGIKNTAVFDKYASQLQVAVFAGINNENEPQSNIIITGNTFNTAQNAIRTSGTNLVLDIKYNKFISNTADLSFGSVPAKADATLNYWGSHITPVSEAGREGNLLNTAYFPYYINEAMTQLSTGEASVTHGGVTTPFETLAGAITAAADGDTVTLLKEVDIKSTITINKSIIIDGNNNIVDGTGMTSSYIAFNVTGGAVAIKNMTIRNFGKDLRTIPGAAVIKVSDNADADTALTIDNVTITGFCRVGIAVQSGGFTIYDSNIDCSNTNAGALTKGIAAGLGLNKTTGVIENCYIYDSQNTYSTKWSAGAIEVYANSEVEITGCTIYNVANGVWVDAYYPAGVTPDPQKDIAIATITNSKITAVDAVAVYHSEIYNGVNYPSLSNGIGKVIIENGDFSGNVLLFKEINAQSNESTITISGGYFTTDPSVYAAKGKIAVSSNKTGYNFAVVEMNLNAAEVAIGEPVVKVNTDNIPEELKAAVQDIASAIESGVIANGLAGSAGNIAQNNTYAADNIILAGTVLDNADEEDIIIVIEPYLEISISGYEIDNTGAVTVSLDILTFYNVVATTDVDNIDKDANAVNILSGQPMTVNVPVTITIPITNELYTTFSGGSAGNIYIQHIKDNKSYYYAATLGGNDGSYTLSFTTLHGFSPFIIKTNAAVAAKIGDVYYDTLQNAVDDVKDGEAITLVKDGTYTATVSRACNFTVVSGDGITCTVTISAGSGYQMSVNGNTYTFTAKSPDIPKPNPNPNPNPSPNPNPIPNPSPSPNPDPDPKPEPQKCDGGANCPGNYFMDVDTGKWYHEAVDYVVINKIMKGTGETTFAPDSTLTRAMLVQILWNLDGNTKVNGEGFEDVSSSDWYYDAVIWASENGIVSGYGNGKFGPNDNVTREQMAVILYNYCAYKGVNLPVNQSSGFADADSISSWAAEAVNAIFQAGILNGKGEYRFDPQGTATRAEAAQMFMNFIETIK